MIKEAIEKIEDMALDGLNLKLCDREYTFKKALPVLDPVIDPIFTNSLRSILDFFKHASTDFRGQHPIIHVVNPNEVRVISETFGTWHQRHFYMSAKAQACNYQIRSAQIEDAIVILQTNFEANEDRTRLLAYLGNICNEEITTAVDDGITQTVTVKNSFGRLENKPISPLFMLSPYRTFREVEQPVTAFVIRLSKSGKGLPLVSLFEADGNGWQNIALQNIKHFLDINIEGAYVIA